MCPKGVWYNTGRTHFKKGFIPWNKGKKMILTEKAKKANILKRGISLSKPFNFPETMRKVNPPLGKKKKYSSRDREKKQRVWRDGYVFIYCPERPSSRKIPPDFGYILEHRAVMEDKIGRQIIPGEVIHHIDGCKSNNKIENLLLCQNSKEHNEVHGKMEIFVEKFIREGRIFYDREKRDFYFR